MKRTVPLLLFVVASAYGDMTANMDKVLTLQKAAEPIVVDGIMESAWAEADSIVDFFQLRPYFGVNPSRRTVARIMGTEDALYCLMVCYDDRTNIQNTRGKLDDFNGDKVSLMLDTFGNRHTAYKFIVNAAGVRSDCKLLDDARNRDYSWDGIWFADAKVHDWGYVVEMKIPYKSIQYDGALEAWGMDLDRWRPRDSEDLYWCEYEENEGQRISKFGTLILGDMKPDKRGLNLEIYPVAMSKASYIPGNRYELSPTAGLDVFYNPSPKLTFQLTANPDFAQIEADPYEFNISRYETYFSERRPFFTEGNEIFMASGRQMNTGFYRPMELFYSRRIGKKLPDGGEVPLLFGTKAFGRINDWEYGGFLAMTGEKEYTGGGEKMLEDRAVFGTARVKKQILGNSSVGFLYSAKHTDHMDQGVLDIDGAFRKSSWQLSYQLARSYSGNRGGFAGSAGFVQFADKYMLLVRGRAIGDSFDIEEVGFVPWKGTSEIVGVGGPRWYFEQGTVRSILIYAGGFAGYEKVDEYTDYGGIFGYNMQFRRNWGFEIGLDGGDSKDMGRRYTAWNLNFSSWYNISPKWHGQVMAGYSRTFNFTRDYLAFYSFAGIYFEWQAMEVLQLGTTANVFFEGDPEGNIEDITCNARPFVSATPVNNLNLRLYVDNLAFRSTGRLEQVLFGFLFSYNFSPKSWIYFAYNDLQDRSSRFDGSGNLLPNRLHVVDREGVFKIKYLYYF